MPTAPSTQSKEAETVSAGKNPPPSHFYMPSLQLILPIKLVQHHSHGPADTLDHIHNSKPLPPKPPLSFSTEADTANAGEFFPPSHFYIHSQLIIWFSPIELLCHHPRACRILDPGTQSQVTVTNTPSSAVDSISSHEHRWDFFPPSYSFIPFSLLIIHFFQLNCPQTQPQATATNILTITVKVRVTMSVGENYPSFSFFACYFHNKLFYFFPIKLLWQHAWTCW
jgi:hypothetical protein